MWTNIQSYPGVMSICHSLCALLILTWYPFSDHNIYPSVGGNNNVEIVLIHDFFGNLINIQFHILTKFHCCSIIIVLNGSSQNAHYAWKFVDLTKILVVVKLAH